MAVTLRFMMKRAVILLVASLFCYTGGGLVDAACLTAANISSKAVSSLTSNPPDQYCLKCPDHVIKVPEGGTVTLQCSLHPPPDLTGYTLDVKRSDLPVNGEVVCAYRNGQDYPDPQMPMYKNRVILVHNDLPRGMVTVQIYPVNLSDSGQYTFSVPKLKIGSDVNLTVVSKPESFNSSSIRPPAEDPVDPEKEEGPVWKIIVPIIVPILVVAVLLLLGFVIKKCKQKQIKRLTEGGMEEEEGSKQGANATDIPLVQKKEEGESKDGASKTDENSYL